MRRPRPRFDVRRNAWVTNAGGKLKLLARGPKTASSEAAAYDAFYAHMAKLGRPVRSREQRISLGALADLYDEWMQRQIAEGQMKPATRVYYIRHIQAFLDAAGGSRLASEISPHDLELFKTSWHSVQTVQRLFNWGAKMKKLRRNPLRGVERPRLGQRRRILSQTEIARLLRAADPAFRQFLLAMRQTLARPQEIRSLQWQHLRLEPAPAFVLADFKAKHLRKDGVEERLIPVDDRLSRLLGRLLRSRTPRRDDFIFLNRAGKPWTANAVRCRMRRLREKLGFGEDDRGEKIVAYTLRHTGATRATSHGVRDRMLADLMGHSNTATTARYQHVPIEPLVAALKQANRRRPTQ